MDIPKWIYRRRKRSAEIRDLSRPPPDELVALSNCILEPPTSPIVKGPLNKLVAFSEGDSTSTAASEAFLAQYEPLDHHTKQIRLLGIISVSEREQIQCVLHKFHLADAPKYTAVSYAWGSNTNLQRIKVNDDLEVSIRQNLFDFLLHCGAEDDLIWLWIDQLCIDQNHVEEKNQQVALMGEIYERAEETVVWLGRDENAGMALEYVKNALEIERQSPIASHFAEDHYHQRKHRCTWWDFFGQHVEIAITPEQQSALSDLWRRPYWYRHWIAQEVALAKSCTILYGTARIVWDDFVEFHLSVLGRLVGYRGVNKLPLAPLLRFTDVIRNPSQSDENVWEAATRFAERSICQDPRDKVYGLRSLFRADLRPPVDYKLSTSDVFLLMKQTWQKGTNTFLDSNTLPRFEHACVDLAYGMGLRVESVPGLDSERAFRLVEFDTFETRQRRSLIRLLKRQAVSNRPGANNAPHDDAMNVPSKDWVYKSPAVEWELLNRTPRNGSP